MTTLKSGEQIDLRITPEKNDMIRFQLYKNNDLVLGFELTFDDALELKSLLSDTLTRISLKRWMDDERLSTD
jgi:hypothetical protein